MAPKTPKPLGLRIKRHWLEEIAAGRKKIEYRDFTEHYAARFGTNGARRDDDGYIVCRKDIKQLRLYVSSKEYAIVQLKKIDIFTDKNDNTTFRLHIGKLIEDKSKERLKSTPGTQVDWA
jgi:hypothetical protein